MENVAADFDADAFDEGDMNIETTMALFGKPNKLAYSL
jgi:hypothetical protein